MTQIFFILVASGLLLIGLEIFVPGGILGVLGSFALLASIVVAFSFGPQIGLLATLAIILLLGICIVLWIKFLPMTPIGRALTLSKDGAAFKSTPATGVTLLDKEGVTLTALRPAGLAKIEGQRIDVVTEGAWIDENTRVRVIKVEGHRLTVRAVAGDTRPPEQEPRT